MRACMRSARNCPSAFRQNCASDAGWKAFLAAHGFTAERVEAYLATAWRFCASLSSASGRAFNLPAAN